MVTATLGRTRPVKFASLRVQLVGSTQFHQPDVPWETDAEGGQALVEFAGRAC